MGNKVPARKPYSTDVGDDEWTLAALYLTLITEEAPQRHYALREVFNALRLIVPTEAPWRYLPGDFPPWETVSQQTRRLAEDDERLPEVVAGLHFLAFATLMLHRLVTAVAQRQ